MGMSFKTTTTIGAQSCMDGMILDNLGRIAFPRVGGVLWQRDASGTWLAN